MSRAGRIARRTFLIGSAAIAGGFAVGYYMYRRPFPNPLEAELAPDEATFNPYLRISENGPITIIVPRAEMGQGVTTTLAALVAEELDVDLDQIEVEHGPAASAYANLALLEAGVPLQPYDETWLAEMARGGMGVVGKFLAIQATGGSSSAIDAFERMREAGAHAREALKAAAAMRLNVEPEALTTQRGVVRHDASQTAFSYQELARDAVQHVPASVELRPRSQWRLLGTSQPRTDMRAKATGAPIFGIDVALPDMLHATIRMNPHLGAPMVSMDATRAEAMAGVIAVVPIRTYLGEGFGVIARTTWHAFRAADAVDVEWGAADGPTDTAEIFATLDAAMAASAGNPKRDDGNVDAAFADAPRGRIVEAEYRAPMLAHTAMEPINATARFADGRLALWVPTQVPTLMRMACAREAGIDAGDCKVHTTALGGGFGRRLELDAGIFATRLAMAAQGRPVKMTWTREEDTTHDMYRPPALGRFAARLGEDGLPVAVDMKISGPSIVGSVMPRFYPCLPAPSDDPAISEGSHNQPYAIDNYRVATVPTELGLPFGFWRSVGNSVNGFFHECFMDEIAAAGGLDPIDLRRQLMAQHVPAIAVIDRVAQMAQWETTPPPGHSRGFAFTMSFGSWVAEIVEVSGTAQAIRIEKVWIAADLGTILDPCIVEAQLVSAAIYGISAAIDQQITIRNGVVEQTNFHDFDALRMHQCPGFEVALLENAPRMGGAGEIGTPPAIPALVNAVSALTGIRVRELPLSREVSFA